MVQKRETKAINKLCVGEILSLSFVCGAYFFEFRGRNLVCFGIAYNFNRKFTSEAGKGRMGTAFFHACRVTLHPGERNYAVLETSEKFYVIYPGRQANPTWKVYKGKH